MSGKLLIPICLLLVMTSGTALAQYKGLLLLGDLNQSLVLEYDYSGQESKPKNSGSSTSTQHRFTETYNAGIEYSLLHKNILNGHLKVGLGLDQEIYSGSYADRGNRSWYNPEAGPSNSSSGSKYSYDLDGIIFKISPTPANFSARSETTHIFVPFTSGYDVTTDSYAVGASFNHKIIGLRVDYQNTTSKTSGAPNDTRTTNSLFMLKADNTYKNSETEVQLTHTTSNLEQLSSFSTVPGNSVSYSILGKNTLVSSQRDMTLSSNVAYREEKLRETTKNFTLAESLNWQLGKALVFNATYENNTVSAPEFYQGAATDTTQQIGTLSLTHLLYKSLSTRLRVQARQTDWNIGRETEYNGSANFAYIKKIFTADTLTLNYSEEYSVVDRNLTSGVLTAIDEPMTAQLFGSNQLRQPNIIESSIIVRDQANPLIRYNLNSDYRIIRIGAYTGLDFSITGSMITDGRKLLISYQYNVDANSNFRRSAHIGNGAITFAEGVYQLYSSFSVASQETTYGQGGIAPPGNSLEYSFGATRYKNGYYTNVLYVNSNSDQVKYQYVEGTCRISRNFAESSVNAQIRDRQTWYGDTSYNAAHTENQFSFTADYSRNVFSNAVLTLRGAYFRVAASGGERNFAGESYYTRAVSANRDRSDVILESIYRWGLGKLFLEVSGKMQFRDTNGDNIQENQVHLRLTRNF